jgi:heme/copper-type cytochrome/quinol oxidase subunit 3
MPDAAVAMGSSAHDYTATGVPTRKVGFWTFIGSECLFFGTLIATYMVYKGASVQGPYPEEILNIPLTTVSTFVLLMSSLAMVLALDGVNRGRKGLTLLWLGMVIVLGLGFLSFQVYEFTHFVSEGLTIPRNVFGTTFFVLTGFHGAHVTVGVIWMSALFTLAFFNRLPPSRSLSVEIAGLYWHFVDIVWIAIFTLIYLIQ